MAGEAVQAVHVYKNGNIRTLKPDKRRERIEKMKRVLIKKEDIKQYVFVIKELTAREIKRKYARSSLGIIWSVLNPLLMMIVMSLIFSTMFKSKIENFPIYYLTGSLFLDFFSGATN
ncbi:MAG: ABC transporter permease [Agathobacter sp.]|nr:ABC transporter permease [Agathobacter sp.]